jgi:geranylgeranyl transferase type-2 subunit alpha
VQHGVPRFSAIEKDADKERNNIQDYRRLVQLVHDGIKSQNGLSQDTLALTSTLLRKNPEYYTVWNFRRRIINHLVASSSTTGGPDDDVLNLIHTDLQFLVPLLVQFPKCYWIWNYRLWLLRLADACLPAPDALAIWRQELHLASKMLARDERNFHGWDYRRHVVSRIDQLAAQSPDSPSLLEPEFEYTTKMIRKSLHNFSALHYRSKLIPRLLQERHATSADRRAFLAHELDMMQEALVDPYNQSAWFYHQFLMSTIHPACPPPAMIVTDLSHSHRQAYYDQEMERIQEMLEDFDDCKWIYQALLQYDTELSSFANPGRARSPHAESWQSELHKLDPMRRGRWNNQPY